MSTLDLAKKMATGYKAKKRRTPSEGAAGILLDEVKRLQQIVDDAKLRAEFAVWTLNGGRS